jgi:cytochrome c oxidase subunit 1
MGSYVLGLGIFIYFATMVYTYFKGEKIGRDPWDGRTLEWSLPTPPPEYNFAVIPTVHARDAFWYEKHHQEEIAKEKAAHAKEDQAHGGIHMPFPSIYPFVASVGLLILAIGATVFDSNWSPGIHIKLGLVLFGGAVTFTGIYLWALEGNEGYHLHPEGEDHTPDAKH